MQSTIWHCNYPLHSLTVRLCLFVFVLTGCSQLVCGCSCITLVIERPPNQSTEICVFGCFDAHAVAVQRAAARREKTDANSQTSEKNDTVAAVQISYGMAHLPFCASTLSQLAAVEESSPSDTIDAS